MVLSLISKTPSSAVKLWNNLSQSLIEIDNIDDFKQSTRTLPISLISCMIICVLYTLLEVLQGVVTSILPIDTLATGIKKFDRQNIALITWFYLSKKLDSWLSSIKV